MAIADRIAEIEKGVSFITFQRLIKRLGVSEDVSERCWAFLPLPFTGVKWPGASTSTNLTACIGSKASLTWPIWCSRTSRKPRCL